ncbi:radical SAM/SPASM domain-containing protein [Alkaliphilus transvaalensis]|uniref:radical SAM/SPASM domain-containing protein n=1 Tax=Alkaliphilus transvaalensis TaxID=114628 RepID=UPI00068758F8|nr:radical SAM protein [Alkaliphilus transvaalensis]
MNFNKRNSYKKRIQQWGWNQGKKLRANIHDLNYFFWEATLKCNLNCLHCGSDCSKDNNCTELPAEKVLQVFSNIAENYSAQDVMVAVTGGEPLMRRDLFDVLNKVNQLGFSWGMVTNGMLVNENVVKKCAETGMKTVSVSLDGVRESHNWLRNEATSYDRAIGALRLFSKANKFDTVEAITCVNPVNLKQLDELYREIKNLGINSWRILTIFPKGRAVSSKALSLKADEFKELFSFIKEKRQQDSKLHINYSEEGYLGCDWEKEVRDDFYYCGAGINIAGLLWDGAYSACPSLSRNWIQGSINDSLFSDVWETKYANMRNRDWMKKEHCKGCHVWSNCQGSSLHLWDWDENKPQICHYRLLSINIE